MNDFLLARVAVIWADTPKSAMEIRRKAQVLKLNKTKPKSANEPHQIRYFTEECDPRECFLLT